MIKMKTYSRKKVQKDSLLNFNESCRLCLLPCTQRFPIFNDFDTTLPLKINACTGIEVYENDGFPPHICLTCQKTLDVSFTFREKSQESHNKLCHIINKLASAEVETSHEVDKVSNTTHSETSITDMETCKQEKNDNSQEFITSDPYVESPRDRANIMNNITKDMSSTPNDGDKSNIKSDYLGTSNDLPEVQLTNEIDGEEVYSINIGVEREDPSESDTFSINIEDVVETVSPDANIDDRTDSENVSNKAPAIIKLSRNNSCENQNTSEQMEISENSVNEDTPLSSNRNEVKNELLFKCGWCFEKFSDRTSFYKHVAEHKDKKYKKRKYACGICDRLFKTHLAFTRHAKIHADLDTFTCKICNKLFNKYPVLNRHYITHSNERPYECTVCGKSYTQREGLRNHTAVAHPDNPEEITLHECPICEKSFCHPSGLSRHIILHTGKTYDCLSCPKKFTDSSSLKRHARSKNHKY